MSSIDRRIRGISWGKSGGVCFYALGHWDSEEFFQEALPAIRKTLGPGVDAEPSISSEKVQHLRFKPMPEREAMKRGLSWGVQLERRAGRGYDVTALILK